jgi:outer membrane protein, heavy metal efflux system
MEFFQRTGRCQSVFALLFVAVGSTVTLPGCSTSRQAVTSHWQQRPGVAQQVASSVPVVEVPVVEVPADEVSVDEVSVDEVPVDDSPVTRIGYIEGADVSAHAASNSSPVSFVPDSLADLEAQALVGNPSLQRLELEVQAAWAKAGYADKLPDPTIGANVFGQAIETAAGSQPANFTVAQMIPWLKRLDAKAQQACYDAMMVQESLRAEQLRVTAETRIAWYRLFVLNRQIDTIRANQELLSSLIEVANSRVATGTAAQGDVLLGTLELSRLQEQLMLLQQQTVSTKAELNRAIGRDSSLEVNVPETLTVSLPDWSHMFLRQQSVEHQPAIAAAQLRTHATHWGIEIARLERRPNVAVNANWFLIDDNRPAPGVVAVGRDAWSLGAQVSLPLWHDKYDAMEHEAAWKHSAALASVDEVTNRYDALLRDLWEQARVAGETRQLYEETILPQARQTLDADQQSYANGAVEFDRIVRDFRNVLTLEDGRHRATGQLATALARIVQAVGTEID